MPNLISAARRRSDLLQGLALGLWGAVLFAVPQMYAFHRWPTSPGWQGENESWFLSSIAAAVIILSTLAAGSVLAGALANLPLPAIVKSVTLGAVVALSIILFVIGPGDLFPIVVAESAVLCGIAVLLGSAIGALIHNFVVRARLEPSSR